MKSQLSGSYNYECVMALETMMKTLGNHLLWSKIKKILI
jgi:hypothetical protein